MKTPLLLLAVAFLSSAQTTRPVVLTWKAPATGGAVNYIVSRGVLASDGSVSGFVQLTVAPIPDLTYIDTTAVPGSTYAYQIQTSVPPCVSSITITLVCGAGNAKTPPAATIIVAVPLLPQPPNGLAAAIP